MKSNGWKELKGADSDFLSIYHRVNKKNEYKASRVWSSALMHYTIIAWKRIEDTMNACINNDVIQH